MPFFGTRKNNKQRMNESRKQRIRNNELNYMIAKAEYLNKKQTALNKNRKNAVTRSKLFNNNFLKMKNEEKNREFTALLEKNPNNNYLKWRRNKGLTAKTEKNNQGSNNHNKYVYNKYLEQKRRNRELAAKLEKNPSNWGSNNYSKYVKSMNDEMQKYYDRYNGYKLAGL
jgi:hypothetical protein